MPRDLEMVFSSRFVEGIPFIERTLGYDKFRAKSHELSTSGLHSVKVVTDISNFYDRLNLHRLESALTDIGCCPVSVKAINEILMHWANRNSYGIPVGCDASRLLSEAMLIGVDNQLIEHKVPFVRYVDDYRMFASSYMEAHSYLNILINALDREGLFINSDKTKIVSCNASENSDADKEDGAAPAKDFDAIDSSERIAVAKRISDGYRTRISIFYREPGKDAIEKLKKMSLDDVISEDDGDDIKEDVLRLFVKVFIYGDDHDPSKIGVFIRRRVHMLGYVVSALIKEADLLSPETRDAISADFETLYSELDQTDYYRICVARLLSSDPYYRNGVFGRWFGRLSVHANPLFTRELITFFRGKITRAEMRQLVEYSHNAHVSVRRAVVAVALDCSALKGERAAWAKVWRNASSDLYILAKCRDFLQGPELPDKF